MPPGQVRPGFWSYEELGELPNSLPLAESRKPCHSGAHHNPPPPPIGQGEPITMACPGRGGVGGEGRYLGCFSTRHHAPATVFQNRALDTTPAQLCHTGRPL